MCQDSALLSRAVQEPVNGCDAPDDARVLARDAKAIVREARVVVSEVGLGVRCLSEWRAPATIRRIRT
jgi:hypothetical protein